MTYKLFFKGLSYLLIIPVLFFSCSEDESIPLSMSETEQLSEASNPNYVNYEEALEIAIKWLTNNNATTRAEGLKVKNHYEFSANNHYLLQTRADALIEDSIDVRFHVINFEDNAGFALVSADNRTTPVYAYSTESNLDLKEGMENTGLSVFMEGAIKRYSMETRGHILPPRPYDPVELDSMILYPKTTYNGQECYMVCQDHHSQTGPFLSTLWNQCSPYNYYCPIIPDALNNCEDRAAAGCVTIALAQIMAYHNYPYYWNWDLIHSSPYYYSGIHNESSNEVAQFIYSLAVAANVSFGRESSSNNYNANEALENWNYSTSEVQNFSYSDVTNSVRAHMPVYCSGTNPYTNKGHAWVIDGYRQRTTIATYYTVPKPHVRLGEEAISLTVFYHCNWGWGGMSNGFFIDTFRINDNMEYSVNNKIIYNIHPNI